MKPLPTNQRRFKLDQVTYIDRKTIQLDRMLLNLFELLRFDGRPAVRRRRRPVDVDALVQLMHQSPDRFLGFADHPEIAEAWLVNDLLEIMNRGKPDREVVVGPRPFHLNAFKLANPKAVQDYGASIQVWAMLFHADPSLLQLLKNFFGRGVDPVSDTYDGSTKLDLETLAILGLVDQVQIDHQTVPQPDPIKPVCMAQARVLADDLRRLLAYEDVIPRHVLALYMRTAIGLHLALYILRLFRIVPDAVERARRGDDPPPCATDCGIDDGETNCPYHHEIIIDLTDNPTSKMATLATASATAHYDSIPEYVRAVIVLNRLKDYADGQAMARRRQPVNTIWDLLTVLADPPSDMDGFFQARIRDILSDASDEAEDPIVESIVSIDGLSWLDKYVELVCLQRLKNERSRIVHLVDSLAQKNRPGGFLRQAASARSPRWFNMGSNLLETLVQIAVVGRTSSGEVTSQNLLLDDFVDWLRTRYGFIIYAPSSRPVPPDEHDAWRANERALRERLHQIGFYSDLSDAYNSQTIRPRYKVELNG